MIDEKNPNLPPSAPEGYYESAPAQPAEKPARSISKAERLLLLGVLPIGGIFSWLWHESYTDVHLTVVYGAFWLVYLLVFRILCPAQWKARGRVLGYAAIALIVLNGLQPWFGSSDGLFGLPLMNFFGIPFLLMLHAQSAAWEVPREREAGSMIGLWFHGFFVQPFSSIPAFFRAIGTILRIRGKAGVLIGIAVAIPIAGIVLWLLMGADAVLDTLLPAFFSQFELGQGLSWVITALVAAMLFYSFLWRLKWGAAPAFLESNAAVRKISPTPLYVVVGTLLVIYAVFTYVQFVYLFGGAGLPAHLTYSEYAHEGFQQLIWVAAINFSLFAFLEVWVRETPALKGLAAGLLAATAVILASAFFRIGLYIDAYGLTLKRVMVVWFLLYLSAVLALAGVRLKKRGLPVLRFAAIGFVYWYLVLNVVDLSGLYVS